MPYKISVYIVLFLIAFNGGHVMLESTGTYDYMGLSTDPGDVEKLDKETKNLQKYPTGKGTGSTLFGLYNALANVVQGLFNAIFPGFKMLKNVGVPAAIVDFLATALAIIPGYDILKFLRSG